MDRGVLLGPAGQVRAQRLDQVVDDPAAPSTGPAACGDGHEVREAERALGIERGTRPHREPGGGQGNAGAPRHHHPQPGREARLAHLGQDDATHGAAWGSSQTTFLRDGCEPLARRPADVLPVHGLVALEGPSRLAPVPQKRLCLPERMGHAVPGRELVERAAAQERAGPGQLPLRHPARGDPVELRPECRLRLPRRRARRELHRDEEDARVGAPGPADPDRDRHLRILDQAPAQPGALPRGQARLQNVEHRRVRFPRGRAPEPGQHRRGMCGVADGRPALTPLGRLTADRRWHRRTGRDGPVGGLDAAQQVVGVDVAADVDGSVPRSVVGPEVVEAVVASDARDVVHPADHRPAVGVGLEDQRLELLLEEAEVGVLGPQPPLLHDHRALLVERLHGDAQGPHPVALEVDDHREAPRSRSRRDRR